MGLQGLLQGQLRAVLAELAGVWRPSTAAPTLVSGGAAELQGTWSGARTAETTKYLVRFEVFTAVTMKYGVFWDVTPCSFCKNPRFGRI
jgi:hypothetical protein